MRTCKKMRTIEVEEFQVFMEREQLEYIQKVIINHHRENNEKVPGFLNLLMRLGEDND